MSLPAVMRLTRCGGVDGDHVEEGLNLREIRQHMRLHRPAGGILAVGVNPRTRWMDRWLASCCRGLRALQRGTRPTRTKGHADVQRPVQEGNKAEACGARCAPGRCHQRVSENRPQTSTSEVQENPVLKFTWPRK